MKAKEKPTIIYIGGIEHCGSTLMGLILDQSPEITCIGELSHLPRAGWTVGSESECSCGARISECAFWREVRHVWETQSRSTVGELYDLGQRFDRNLALPGVLFNKLRRGNAFNRYVHLTSLLFETIQAISGCHMIVDTSKRVTRAVALSMLPGVEFRLIHLIRDSRGVAYSSMKQKREIKRNWLESVLRWNLINGAYAALRPVVGEGRMMQVRYEDLLREPEKTIRALGDFIGIDLTDTARSVADQAILLPGHLAVGNSFIRGSQAIRLNPHDDWREKMSVKMQKRVWRLTRVSMGYFNYEK